MGRAGGAGRAGTAGEAENGLEFGDRCVLLSTSSSLKSSDVAVVCVEFRSSLSVYSAPALWWRVWLWSSDSVTWAPLRRNSANLRVRRDEARERINRVFLNNRVAGGGRAVALCVCMCGRQRTSVGRGASARCPMQGSRDWCSTSSAPPGTL